MSVRPHTHSLAPSPPNHSNTQIGINLSDAMYRGIYHGRPVHPPDLPAVLSRAQTAGCAKFMITGSDLSESERAVALAREHRTLYPLTNLLPPR